MGTLTIIKNESVITNIGDEFEVMEDWDVLYIRKGCLSNTRLCKGVTITYQGAERDLIKLTTKHGEVFVENIDFLAVKHLKIIKPKIKSDVKLTIINSESIGVRQIRYNIANYNKMIKRLEAMRGENNVDSTPRKGVKK